MRSIIKRKLGHLVSPRSQAQIKSLAHEIRLFFELENTTYIKLERLLEMLYAADFLKLAIVEDAELKGKYALTYPDKMEMILTQSTYDKACDNDHRSRFTIAHEIGHLFMHKNQNGYARSVRAGEHKIYEDSEWQADTFASNFLINPGFLERDMDARAISRRFGISYSAAKVWLKNEKKSA